MEKKQFNSIEEEEKDFNNLLNQAAQIKSYQMSLNSINFLNFTKKGYIIIPP